MSSEAVDLSIIIVNWNSAKFIEKCLNSIYRSAGNIEIEIIIVDNASYDECENIIKEKYPYVLFVQSSVNLGFARANNLGYKHSKGKALLFLNPDTEMMEESIGRLYNGLNRSNDAGAIGCKLLNSDLTLQTSCVQPFPTIINQIFDIEWAKHHVPKIKLWGISPINLESQNPIAVEAISGACIMIKRSVFEKVGLFSKDYFMYTEDLDLCYKVKKAGYNVYYDSICKVIHFGGGSTSTGKKNKFSDVMMRESIKTFMHKYHGKNYAKLYQFILMLNAITRICIILFIYAFKKNNEKRYANILNKWWNILNWSLNREKWVKNI